MVVCAFVGANERVEEQHNHSFETSAKTSVKGNEEEEQVGKAEKLEQMEHHNKVNKKRTQTSCTTLSQEKPLGTPMVYDTIELY